MDREEFNSIIERITQNRQSGADLEKLRSLQLNGDTVQSVSQDGKFVVDVGQISGGEIHIGDRVYHGADAEKIRSLIEETLAAALPQPSWYQRPSLGGAALVSASVAVGVTAIRLIGGLQSFELSAYDWLFRTKPSLEKPDDRIALVEITNKDVNNFGTSEISDRKLNQVLEKLVEAKPFSIGLDIFRDEEQPDPEKPDRAKDDYQRLIQFLEKHQILGVCYVSSASVPGASVPSDKMEWSFSNGVVDGQGTDRTVRRQLLKMPTDTDAQCKADNSLGYRLALNYLKPRGIAEAETETQYIQLGNTVLEPVWADTGGYRGIDDTGYQILLNFRQTPFDGLNAEEVLDGLDERERALIKDRIVLVGYNELSPDDVAAATAPIDSFDTPLGPTPGVYIHAYTVSHILSTVIDDDYRHPLIQTWAEPIEILWIVAWCFLGGALSWLARGRVMLLVMTLSGAILIIAIAWVAFAFGGWWLPLIPTLFGFVVTPVGAAAAANYRLLKR